MEAFREIKESEIKMQQQQSWLTGLYVMHAIGCCFSKGEKYPDSPLKDMDNHEPIGEENEILASEEFRAYALALKRQGIENTAI